MVNVTWGPNTVHPIGTPAPAPSTAPFGAPSPAPAPLAFGASSTSTFGTPAPAPAGGGLFGTPAPAPAGGGLFGSPTPAPAGGGFFGAPAPAPTTNLFGAPSPAPSGNLFGAPAPSSFGMSSTQQQQQQQQQIPAQAALQAHLDASARQEAERLGIADRFNIIVGSDFARTPWYNDGNGKDHWSIGSMMFMGSDIQGGRVIGGTDNGQLPLAVNQGIHPDHLRQHDCFLIET